MHTIEESASFPVDRIKSAFEIVAQDESWCEASVYLNGHSLLPTEDCDLLRLVAQYPPIYDQLRQLRDMISEALAE
jgi:hypothetical protein